ncbi:MAG: hypothetical protein UHK60_08660 [Acutalibacteraceae bacterium]|nr:hypothetical protein [Acutalibacteraceae bacterium]
MGMITRTANLVPMDTTAGTGLEGIASKIESFLSTAGTYVYIVAAVCIFFAGLALMVSNQQTRANIKGTMIAIIVGALIAISATAIATELCTMLGGGM